MIFCQIGVGGEKPPPRDCRFVPPKKTFPQETFSFRHTDGVPSLIYLDIGETFQGLAAALIQGQIYEA